MPRQFDELRQQFQCRLERFLAADIHRLKLHRDSGKLLRQAVVDFIGDELAVVLQEVEQLSQETLFAEQSRLGPFALGDVATQSDEPALPRMVHASEANLDRKHLAILATMDAFEGQRITVCRQVPGHLLAALVGLDVEIHNVHRQQFLARVAQSFASMAIDVVDLSLSVVLEKGIARPIDQAAELFFADAQRFGALGDQFFHAPGPAG